MRNRILLPLLAVIAGKAFVPNGRTGSAAAPIPDMDAVRRIVREYLLEHPEVIEEAIRVLQAKRESEEQDRARAGSGSCLPSCYSGFPSPSDSRLYRANSLVERPVRLDVVFKSMGSSPFRFDGCYNCHPAGA